MRKTNSDCRIIIVSDAEAVKLYLVLFCLMLIPSLFVSFWLFFVQPSAVKAFATAMFICCVSLGVTLAIEARKWASKITVSESGLDIQPFLNKGYKKKFSEMPFLTKAWRSRSLRLETEALRKYYLVISDYELSDYERSKINYLSNSQHAIKIEFNKKNYQKLLELLPEGHKVQLIEQFADLVNK